MRARGLAVILVAPCRSPSRRNPHRPPRRRASGRDVQAEIEEFLRVTPFEKVQEVPIGVTKPMRGYFPPGGLVRSAAWKRLPPGRSKGYWESYRSEIAAYELDKFFGMRHGAAGRREAMEARARRGYSVDRAGAVVEGGREPAKAGALEHPGRSG